jgi:hypothetical protein
LIDQDPNYLFVIAHLSRSGVSFPIATASRIGKYLATVGSLRIQVRKWSLRFVCVIPGLRISVNASPFAALEPESDARRGPLIEGCPELSLLFP